jgi:ribosome maturation factor RimP
MDLTAAIHTLAEGLLKDESFFIVDVTASVKRKPGKIVVVLDGDGAVSIDDCAELSRKLSDALDSSNMLDDNYQMEVTTPGLDHPLRMHRQYKKNIGRVLKVKLKEDSQPVEGTLIRVGADSLILEQSARGKKESSKEVGIPFVEIEKAFVTISFK